jgi:hypothetical protein
MTIKYRDITASVKDPLITTRESTVSYGQEIDQKFSPIGVELAQLTRTTKNVVSGIDRYIADGVNIAQKHPDPPNKNTSKGLEEHTQHRSEIDPRSLIGQNPHQTQKKK